MTTDCNIDDQLQNVIELISLPEIYIKFNQLMDDPTADNDDFARLVQLDPSLTAKLLQVVNSAYFGLSGQINSVNRAVNMIGIQQLHIMVLSIYAVSAVSALTFPKDIVDLKSFWRSSLLSATLSRDLAMHLKLRPYDRFFMLGLLHEIGHLVLYSTLPDLARQTVDLAEQQQLQITIAEQEVLGCHYGQIGAKLMEHWQLPQEFQFLTQYQPTPQQTAEAQPEASLLHIAHAFAHRQFINNEVEIGALVVPVAWQATGLSEAAVEPFLDKALSACAEMEKMLMP